MTTLAIQPGDRLKDNAPRIPYNRVLTVEALCLDAEGKLEKVQARERPGSQLVRIAAKRIFAAGKPRRSEFTLMPAEQLDPRVSVLVGKEIQLRRGSESRIVGPGSKRSVRARLDQVEGIMVHATLLEDDPLATTAPYKAGESGTWHGLSFIEGPTP